MDLSYNTMRFGKKGHKITVYHLRKPVRKGLAGMVTGSIFPEKIALVVDPRPRSEFEYSYMCISHNRGIPFDSVWMEAEAFYGIKRGDKMARTALFHELGHYYLQHLKGSEEEINAYNLARSEAVDEGKVIQDELDADQFAVDYLGKEYVAEGLRKLNLRINNLIQSGVYEEETGKAAMKEISLRIASLDHSAKKRM